MRYRTFGLTFTPQQGQIDVRSVRGESCALPPADALLLVRCSEARTLAEHADAVADLPSTDRGVARPQAAETTPTPESVIATLESFVARGLLRSEDDILREILRSCESHASQKAPGSVRIDSFAMPTRDRPQTMVRSLSTYLENAARDNRVLRVSVIDDSRTPLVRSKNVTNLRALQDASNAVILYADIDRRAAFAKMIAVHASVDSETARFALLGDPRCDLSYGACRNAILLQSAGKPVIQADDDTFCRIASVPDQGPGLSLTSLPDANELWFFDSIDEATTCQPQIEKSIFQLHEEMLGASVAVLVRNSLASGPLDIDTVQAPFAEDVRHHDARVVVSFVGTAGDSGASYPFRFLHDGHTFDRLTVTESAYALGCTTRNLIKGASQRTISDGPFCMTTNVGLDNRELLPPFMPVMRNEDGVFGMLRSTCLARAFSGNQPFTVEHRPPHGRVVDAALRKQRFCSIQTNTMLSWVIAECAKGATASGSSDRIVEMGHLISDIASDSLERFSERIRSIAERGFRASKIRAEIALQRRRDAPDYWRRDVDEFITLTRTTLDRSDFFVPSDLVGNPDERLGVFADLMVQFGGLLIAWPALVQAAVELRELGEELAVPVA